MSTELLIAQNQITELSLKQVIEMARMEFNCYYFVFDDAKIVYCVTDNTIYIVNKI